MSASLEVEYPQFNPPENLSSPPVAEITTPAEPAENCPNCPTLRKENRKLSNSVKTLREAAKKRRAEIMIDTHQVIVSLNCVKYTLQASKTDYFCTYLF